MRSRYISNFAARYIYGTRLRVVLVAGPRYVPFHLYAVLLGVMYKSKVVTVCQRTTNCEYCQCTGQYRSDHIRNVPPRPNFCTRYA